MDDEVLNRKEATVVNSEVSTSLDVEKIKCLFYGVIICKYQICKSLDDKYVFIFEDGKDAMKYKMSNMEEKMKEMESSSTIDAALLSKYAQQITTQVTSPNSVWTTNTSYDPFSINCNGGLGGTSTGI